MVLEKLSIRNKTVWSDFTVLNNTLYTTGIDSKNLIASDSCKLTALNFSRYVGFNGYAYGESAVSAGLTEQQAFDIWTIEFNKQQTFVQKQIISSGIRSLSQTVFDGLVILNWATGQVFYVDAVEGQYNLIKSIIANDIDTVASMIKRSNVNQDKCVRASNIMRLADYGSNKNRTWLRTNGIFNMRDQNEKFLLTDTEIKRARMAYYAETLKFLPFTPESLKRDIANKYNKTLIRQQFIYSGTKTFSLHKQPSMAPAEKLQVLVNGNILQHLFDFTLGSRGSSNQLTISKPLVTSDKIDTIIKI